MKNDFTKIEATNKTLQTLYNYSACTMLGYRPEELHLYVDQLEKEGFLKDRKKLVVFTTTGKQLNETFELDDRFKDDLNIFIISLGDLKNLEKFAVTLRFQMGYRWLDDIVNNSRKEVNE